MRTARWAVGLWVALASVTPALAQAPRTDAIWARSTAGAAITMDGQLNEPAWAAAETWKVRYRYDNGIPGSGWKDEAGFIPNGSTSDSTNATLKPLDPTRVIAEDEALDLLEVVADLIDAREVPRDAHRTRCWSQWARRHAADRRRSRRTGRDLAPPVEATQSNLSADDEPKQEDQRRVFGGQRALGHPDSAGPLPFERGGGGAGGRRALGVDDPVEVGPDLGECVLGRLPLEVAQLVDGTALHEDLGPDEAHGLPQPGVPVDHAPPGRGEPPSRQILEATLPGLEGLAHGAELQGDELLLTVGEDRDDSQGGNAHHLAALQTRRASASR